MSYYKFEVKKNKKNKNLNRRVEYVFVEDEPIEKPVPYMVYIVGEKPYYWVLLLECPCGCREIIYLNLLKEGKHKWSFEIKNKKISIFPSVRKKNRCGSHFVISKGKLVFVKHDLFLSFEN